MTGHRLVGLVGLLGLLAGCGASGAGDLGGQSPSGTGAGNASGAATGAAGSAGPGGGTAGGSGSVTLPPETELESSYEVPIATGRYIWVANPLSGRVAYVDATSLDVHTAAAGNAPTYMAAIPSATDDAVMVLNTLSNDATVMRVGTGGVVQPEQAPSIPDGANSIAVSRDGSWAIAWTDARRVMNASANQGFQDLTFISLANATAGSPLPTFGVSVGFRPVAVAFAADGAHAFAVTQDGISVVDVHAAGGPKQIKNVHVTDDPTENADTRDVSITPTAPSPSSGARGAPRWTSSIWRAACGRPSRCPARSPTSTSPTTARRPWPSSATPPRWRSCRSPAACRPRTRSRT